jgi:formylglycine-generating enzyme required for sulfatase activity
MVLGAGFGFCATLLFPVVRGWFTPTPPAFDPLAQPAPPPMKMIQLPGGKFRMGTPDWQRHPHFADAPEHEAEVAPFQIDETEVTNAQFAEFVKATGYVTVAEQKPTLESVRAGLPPGDQDPPEDKLVPGALVFVQPPGEVINRVDQWWKWTPGACWKHPEGPGSDLRDRMDHPVVQVCWKDAAAYATWAGKRLPTEAEWEFAARGGLVGKPYVWGDEPPGEGGTWRCNIWQGNFPWRNTKNDGFVRTAPVKTFAPNGYGLYDTAGNVWEWCSDWYHPETYTTGSRKDPTGPAKSFDPTEANPNMPKRIQRGGSFLCSDGFCSRYKPAGRGKGDVDSAASHIGFRCVK